MIYPVCVCLSRTMVWTHVCEFSPHKKCLSHEFIQLLSHYAWYFNKHLKPTWRYFSLFIGELTVSYVDSAKYRTFYEFTYDSYQFFFSLSITVPNVTLFSYFASCNLNMHAFSFIYRMNYRSKRICSVQHVNFVYSYIRVSVCFGLFLTINVNNLSMQAECIYHVIYLSMFDVVMLIILNENNFAFWLQIW